MSSPTFKLISVLGVAIATVLAGAPAAQARPRTPIPYTLGAARPIDPRPDAGTTPWSPLTHQPSFLLNGAAAPMLLTDGTVLVQDAGSSDYWRLTPDLSGSYVNGTWTQVASLPSGYAPLYHSSAVLPDGRLIIEGGEYNNFVDAWTNLGAIYDPVANTWTAISPPAFFGGIPGFSNQTIGDAQSIILANGTYMQADCCTTDQALLNPKTLTWTRTGTGKADSNDEEGWTLLKNGKVLTVDAYVGSYTATGTNSELYDPTTGSWSSAGSTVVQLWDSCGGANGASYELGPAVLRANGTVFYTGANSCGAGNTAIFDSNKGTWTAGPAFPKGLDIADGPASWLPNDEVLMMASPGFANTGAAFFLWNGTKLTQIPGTPAARSDSSFYGNMLLLPTGQVLLTDLSNDVEVYTPTISAAALKLQKKIGPVIQNAPSQVTRGSTYAVTGLHFNGVSAGASYGDDTQAATNFPLVRFTNTATSHVAYARTHDHSSMAIASSTPVTTQVDVPKGLETGPSTLQVVVNGIASAPVAVVVN